MLKIFIQFCFEQREAESQKTEDREAESQKTEDRGQNRARAALLELFVRLVMRLQSHLNREQRY